MATYLVWSSGNGSDGTLAGGWANAYQTLTAGLSAATTAGDIIYVRSTHQETITAATTYTIGANQLRIVSVNESYEPTPMGTGGWIGNGSTTYGIGVTGTDKMVYFYGITWRIGGSGNSAALSMTQGSGFHSIYESCFFWNTKTGGTYGQVRCGNSDQAGYCEFRNCTFSWALPSISASSIHCACRTYIVGGGIISSSAAITTFIITSGLPDTSTPDIVIEGFDMSAGASTMTIVGNVSDKPAVIRMTGCKLPSGAFSYIGTQSHVNKSGAEVFATDCSAGDTHINMAYVNSLGSVEVVTSHVFDSGAAGCSWKITTTSSASFTTPFQTPWIDLYVPAGGAVTPYFEILMDGSTSALTDAQVWAEFSAKETSGTVLPTFKSDRQALGAFLSGTAASDQASGAGLSAWTGESGSAWSGKCDSGSSITQAENGHIRGRIVVGASSLTNLFVDPQIRM